MTHIKYPNELGPPVPIEPNWQNEAMRMNALLHSAMTGGAEAEQRAAKLELERDALLRVVTDNHVALMRAEAAEAKLEKAVDVLTKAQAYITDLEEHEGAEGFSDSTSMASADYYASLAELEQRE